MLTLDGREGEGGGQILRIALALGAITTTPFRIHHLRGGRARPGLLRQHLTATRAVAAVCGARVDGAELGSTDLTFVPGPIRAGDHRFAVGSAGSAGLVLQAVVPALWHAPGPSTVEVTGGTHNPAAPPGDFLVRTLAPTLGLMGLPTEIQLAAHGFNPAGGGAYQVRVTPGTPRPLDLIERGDVERIEVTALLSSLPDRIGIQEIAAVREGLAGVDGLVTEVLEVSSPGPGNAVTVAVVTDAITEVFTAFGRRGTRADRVGREVAEATAAHLRLGVPVGPHLADQLMLPLAIAGGQFVTGSLSSHASTAMQTIAKFLGRAPRATSRDDQRCLVQCSI